MALRDAFQLLLLPFFLTNYQQSKDLINYFNIHHGKNRWYKHCAAAYQLQQYDTQMETNNFVEPCLK
jgi:hypothetical protein